MTIVGAAGIGKTALSLRVCNDLIDETRPIFDRIVWVTLKTRYLTPEGVSQIHDSISSLGSLIDNVSKHIKSPSDKKWQGVIDQIKSSKTLLVIDNLETIGEEIRDLVINIPSKSKVLLTSRIGLGEIEVRYELNPFIPKDATALFHSLVTVYNCNTLKRIHHQVVEKYLHKLRFNPLLIKWFILAVAQGADPQAQISKESLKEPLKFFYENIYNSLGALQKNMLMILLAARRGLTKAQLQELTRAKPIPFLKSIQELVRTSMVERTSTVDGTMIFQISGLVYDYLSTNYPPGDSLVKTTRNQIKAWQVEQDKSTVQSETYRYGIKVLHIEKEDDRISAQHLIRAMQASSAGNNQIAVQALEIAEQLTPTWWEVYRVKAKVLENQGKPIYEVEEAYEQSIRIQDNDVNRYHYATYLLRQNEYERILEQIDTAILHADAIPNIFNSLKGLTLMRMGKTEDAIPLLENVWNDRAKKLPKHVGLTQATQLLDAYRRDCDKNLSIGRLGDAFKNCKKALTVSNEVMEDYGCDDILTEMIINSFASISHISIIKPEDEQEIVKQTKLFEANDVFRYCAIKFKKSKEQFTRNPGLAKFFPAIYEELQKLGEVQRYTGKIDFIVPSEFYGFIDSTDLGRVHFSKGSLTQPDNWNKIKSGDIVNFGVVLPRRQDRLPHAVNINLI